MAEMRREPDANKIQHRTKLERCVSYSLEFEIPIAPVAKGRARYSSANGFVRTYTPKKTKDYEASVKRFADIHKPSSPLLGPLHVVIEVYLARIKRPKYSAPCTRPDIDNYVKAILDALNKVIFKDDGQVTHLTASKHYTTDYPKIKIRVDEAA